jgi:hypothetical protein
MKRGIILLLSICCSAQSQSTFSYGLAPQQPRQSYATAPVPMQSGYPMQSRGAPMNNAGGGGIPIGPIIGLVGSLIQSAVIADQQKKARQQSERSYANYDPEARIIDLNTGAGVEEPATKPLPKNAGYRASDGSVYRKVSVQSTPTGARTVYASGPFDKEVGGIPNGIVLPDGNVKSPFSEFIVDVMKYPEVVSGHIITDPNVKKNFRIPGYNYE